MKSYFYHIQINIDFLNVSFYKNLMSFLGWKVIFAKDDVIGYKSDISGDLWFVAGEKKEHGDYDKTGVNHISIRVENIKDIDSVTDYLMNNGIETLFGTPRHRPEFSSNENETYYQIMFTSPDNVLFEIVYIGPKTK